MTLIILGSAALFGVLGAAFELVRGNRTVARLRDLPAEPPAPAPRVSIVIAARDEARNIGTALRSMLGQSYPDFEVVVVDDRSTDGTGIILDDLAATEPRLRVLHLDTLPDGWLGKNHALHTGAAAAGGQLILFTDADIVMEPTVLARAVRYLETHHVDHLAIGPRLHMKGVLLAMFGTMFTAFFALFARPWKARDPRSRAHVGIGAFNLVRTHVYRSIRGHEPIRLRPDDDIKLGKLVKLNGFAQDVVLGGDMLTVEWYSSIPELIRGLRKNSFAGVDYSWTTLLGGAFALLCVHVAIPLLAVLASGTAQALFAAAAVILLLAYADNARFHDDPPWHAIGYPVVGLLFVYILVYNTIKTTLRGGIEWRGTFYSLAELKANKV